MTETECGSHRGRKQKGLPGAGGDGGQAFDGYRVSILQKTRRVLGMNDSDVCTTA